MKRTIIIRKNFEPSVDAGLAFAGEKGRSKTKQAFKEECDINNIVPRLQNGEAVLMNTGSANYGDYSDPTEFHDAQNIVAYAKEQFQALPAKVRDRFANDPGNFLEFTADPENQKELLKMGLATERQAPKPSEGELLANKIEAAIGKGFEKKPPKASE